MIRRKEYIINQLQSPVLGSFAMTLIESQKRRMKEVAKERNRTYTCIESASNNGFSSNYIVPVANQSILDACYAALCVDTTQSPNRLRDENLKNTLRLFLNGAP